jgi:FtsP/CotA-like multicopper oxidase with cupredoxin domain
MAFKSIFAIFLVVSSASFTGAVAIAQNNTVLRNCLNSMNGVLPNPRSSDFTFSGQIRRYYIAAEQVEWDYIPSRWDNVLGVPIDVSPRAYLAGYTAEGSLGLRWQKALYREYTDASFTKLSTQPPWQGLMGPTLRAEVGDMIEILFVNRLPNNYATMHSMGLQYSKDNEGSLYPNNTMPGQASPVAPGDTVAPGECVVYKWLINEGSAPTNGMVSHMWGYHSYISMQEDSNAGLIGNTIVYAAGKMNETMNSYREFVLTYMQYDESNSFMSQTNKQALAPDTSSSPGQSSMPMPALGQGYGNYSIWHPQVVNLMSSNQLNATQAPTFSSLNGLVYANNAPFEVCVNDPTIWYVSAFGSNPHVFHMHGNGFTHHGVNQASISM